TPWGLNSPFRTVTTSSVRTFSFTAWETNRPIVKSLQYKIDVADLAPDVDGVVTFAESGVSTPDRRSWLFDVYDGNVWERFFVPEGEITERGEITYAQGEMVGYEWTISTYPDAAGNLVYHAYMAPEVDEVTSSWQPPRRSSPRQASRSASSRCATASGRRPSSRSCSTWTANTSPCVRPRTPTGR